MIPYWSKVVVRTAVRRSPDPDLAYLHWKTEVGYVVGQRGDRVHVKFFTKLFRLIPHSYKKWIRVENHEYKTVTIST